MKATLDAPGTTCYFESHACSRMADGCGGFDQHHPIPVELGGDPNQPLLPVCPLHHRRQHALIRHLVESALNDTRPLGAVVRRFTATERNIAEAAVAHWDAAGRPTINGWPCPAARRLT